MPAGAAVSTKYQNKVHVNVMRILKPIRPDITGHRVEEFSTAGFAVHLGNQMIKDGDTVAFTTSIERDRFCPGAVLLNVPSDMPDKISIAESFMLYRDDQYDVLHLHTANFASFNQLSKYMAREDRVVCTLHVPASIGVSFFYHHEDLMHLLRTYPNFRLVCVSDTGSYQPLKKFFGDKLPEGWEKVVTIDNAIRDHGIPIVPHSERQSDNCFMFVGHMMESKNVVRTFEFAAENNIPCIYVGRRTLRNVTPKVEAYAAQCEGWIAKYPHLIRHITWVPFDQCVHVMSQVRCMMIFSVLESFGFTPVEAASVGTPTVWTECSGIDDTMIDGVTGFRITRAQSKQWKAKKARAAELFSHVGSLDPFTVANAVRERFSMAACAEKYRQLYRSI